MPEFSTKFQERFEYVRTIYDGKERNRMIYLVKAITDYTPTLDTLISDQGLSPDIKWKRTKDSAMLPVTKGTQYAMKVVRIPFTLGSGGCGDDDCVKGMRHEVQIGLTVTPHPNIVKYYDFNRSVVSVPALDADYVVFEIVMELGAKTLDQAIKDKRFTEFEALDFLKQMLNGLIGLEAEKCLHRDLKPDNFLLFESTDPETNEKRFIIKLFDFDLGTVLVEDWTGHLSTYDGTRGNPLCMAPEKAVARLYTAKGDVWALGIIAIEMLCGASNPLRLSLEWREEVNKYYKNPPKPEMLIRTDLMKKENEFCDLTLRVLRETLESIKANCPELYSILTEKIFRTLEHRYSATDIICLTSERVDEPLWNKNVDVCIPRLQQEEQLIGALQGTPPNPSIPRFIVVRGAEGCGKRTLIRMCLRQFLELTNTTSANTAAGRSELLWWDGSNAEKFEFSLRRSFVRVFGNTDNYPLSTSGSPLKELVCSVLQRVQRKVHRSITLVIENLNPSQFGSIERFQEVWGALQSGMPMLHSVLVSSEDDELSQVLSFPSNTCSLRLGNFSTLEVDSLLQQMLKPSNADQPTLSRENVAAFCDVARELCDNYPSYVYQLVAEAKESMENVLFENFPLWVKELRESMRNTNMHLRTMKFMKSPFGTLGVQQGAQPTLCLYDKLMRLCRVMDCTLLPLSYIWIICATHGCRHLYAEFVELLKKRHFATSSPFPDMFQVPQRHFSMLEPNAVDIYSAVKVLLLDRPEAVDSNQHRFAGELWLTHYRSLQRTAQLSPDVSVREHLRRDSQLQARVIELSWMVGLGAASYFGYVDCVRTLISLSPQTVNSFDVYDRTPLYSACRNKNINPDVIQCLLTAGADVNIGSTQTFCSLPTHGLFFTVEELLQEVSNNTLSESAFLERLKTFDEVAKILKDAGADFSASNRLGETAVGKLLQCLRNLESRLPPAVVFQVRSVLSVGLPCVQLNVIHARRNGREDRSPTVLDQDISLCILAAFYGPSRFISQWQEKQLQIGRESIFLSSTTFQATIDRGQWEVTLQIPMPPEQFPMVCPGPNGSNKHFIPRWELVMPAGSTEPLMQSTSRDFITTSEDDPYLPLQVKRLSDECVARTFPSMFTTHQVVLDNVAYSVDPMSWQLNGPGARNGGILRWVPDIRCVPPFSTAASSEPSSANNNAGA